LSSYLVVVFTAALRWMLLPLGHRLASFRQS
jgi:hypothetical protein